MRSKKEQKLIEQRMALNDTIERMQCFIAELEPKRQLFIEKAKQARKQGATAQENAAKAALKQVVSQQKLANRMLLNFEIMTTLSDVNAMTGEFLGSLAQMGKQMEKFTAKMDFVKAQKELDESAIRAQVQTEKMNEFLEKMNIAMDSGYEAAGGVGDEEIEDMIGHENSESDEKINSDIEQKLAALDGKVSARAKETGQ